MILAASLPTGIAVAAAVGMVAADRVVPDLPERLAGDAADGAGEGAERRGVGGEAGPIVGAQRGVPAEAEGFLACPVDEAHPVPEAVVEIDAREQEPLGAVEAAVGERQSLEVSGDELVGSVALRGTGIAGQRETVPGVGELLLERGVGLREQRPGELVVLGAERLLVEGAAAERRPEIRWYLPPQMVDAGLRVLSRLRHRAHLMEG